MTATPDIRNMRGFESIGFQGLPPDACAAMRRAPSLISSAITFCRTEQRARVTLQKLALFPKELIELLGSRTFSRIEHTAGGFVLIFDDRRSAKQRAADDHEALRDACVTTSGSRIDEAGDDAGETGGDADVEAGRDVQSTRPESV